jgi:hypothetical protein
MTREIKAKKRFRKIRVKPPDLTIANLWNAVRIMEHSKERREKCQQTKKS